MIEQSSEDSFGARIRRLREQKGWSLSELASRASISRSYLAQVESGKSAPTEEKIIQLANALGARASELLGEQPGERPVIPPSLDDFAKQANLGTADVYMLAHIEYRGKKPKTVEEWRAIYSIIKGMLDDEE